MNSFLMVVLAVLTANGQRADLGHARFLDALDANVINVRPLPTGWGARQRVWVRGHCRSEPLAIDTAPVPDPKPSQCVEQKEVMPRGPDAWLRVRQLIPTTFGLFDENTNVYIRDDTGRARLRPGR